MGHQPTERPGSTEPSVDSKPVDLKPVDSKAPLFPPTYRLGLLCLLVGGLGALAAFAFDFLVDQGQHWLLEGLGGFVPPPVGELAPAVAVPQGWDRLWLPVVTTLGGLLSGLLVFTLAPEAEGHGTDAAVSAYHHHGGHVRSRVPFVKGLASAITLGSGGVAGREGPTAQIAVGLSSVLSNGLGLRGQERRILMLAAMAAGLAAIFQAPLGMAIFTVEILYAGMVFESEALIYTVISATTAYAIYGFFVGWTPIFAIPGGLAFHEPLALLGFAALGVLAGVLGAILPTLFYGVRELFRRIPGPPHWKPALGGFLVGLLALAVPELLGAGYGWVELALAGQLPLATILLLLLLKGPAMSLTIGSGGSGGVFGPTVVLGAMLGAAVGLGVERLLPAVGAAPAAFVVVGMAAVFAGAARTPLSTLIMTAEMTGGYGLIVPAMLANVLAFVVQRSLTVHRRHPTLYESQVAAPEESPVHRGVFVRRALELLEGGQLQRSELTLPRLTSLLEYGDPIPVTRDGHGFLVTVELEEGSLLAEETVAAGLGIIDGLTAVAVLRGEEMKVPRGPTRLGAGDQLVAIATPEAHLELQRRAASPETPSISPSGPERKTSP